MTKGLLRSAAKLIRDLKQLSISEVEEFRDRCKRRNAEKLVNIASLVIEEKTVI